MSNLKIIKDLIKRQNLERSDFVGMLLGSWTGIFGLHLCGFCQKLGLQIRLFFAYHSISYRLYLFQDVKPFPL